MSDQPTSEDPREQGAKPEFPEQPQEPAGLEEEMDPKPDYGEDTYRGSGKLQGKVALITGGDSGIGRAVALAFAREGADVLISYLDEEQDAQKTVRIVEKEGRKCIAVAGDIGDEAHCQQLVQRAVSELGRLDILVNNAAYQMSHESIQELTSEEIEHTFRTNIFAMFYLCKAALPQMQPGASIINTCSVQAYKPSSSLLAYASTKGAIVTFTKGLAQEAIQSGVRVNVVAPGPVWTPLIPSTMPPEQASTFGQDSLLERPAQPKELAPLYVFLASDEASYVTGERYGISGTALLP
jgi:hypothetical protein